MTAPDRNAEFIAFIGQAACMLIEEVNADAVVICVTRQRKGHTETYVRPFGNMHACRGVVEYAYNKFVCTEEDEAEEEEGDDDED